MSQLFHSSSTQRGMALLVVLWTLSLLALLAVAFAQNAWLERHRVRNFIDSATAKASLQAGLSLGIAALLKASKDDSWPPDGTAHQMLFATSDLTIAVQDANGCMNINTATIADIGALLRVIGLDKNSAQSLAAAIVDWRDDDRLVSQGGAEERAYADASLAQRPANRPFFSTQELNGVFGMTPAIAERLLPLVSISPTTSEINRSTAPEQVLRADATIPPEEVTAIMMRRAARKEAIASGTEMTLGLGAAPAEPRSATQADLVESVEGPVFSISIDVVTAAGAEARGRAEVWLTLDPDQPYRILEWLPMSTPEATIAMTP